MNQPGLSKIGKYEIRSELGRGAMGIVYEGFDPFIERTVAIKTIQKSLIQQSDDPEVLSRFRREAQAAGRLSHPNIVAVHEYGEDGDVAFIAMEFIKGKELKGYFDRGERFVLADSVRIMVQLLDALSYSHERGVVHRDIKPSNIVITHDNKIKVVDFGIAKIESSDLTQVGTVLGTPTYMSPEQFMGLAADPRSDLYSAGVVLYQFLTGEKPFSGSMTTIMQKVLNQAPVPPRTLNPDITKAMEDVVKRAMSKNPDDRFQSAAEFRQTLEAALHAPPAYAAPPLHDGEATMVSTTHLTAPVPATDPENFDFASLLADISQVVNEPVQNANNATPSATPSQSNDSTRSRLLQGLAREAEASLSSRSLSQHGHEPAQHVHAALDTILQFFTTFAQHLSDATPPVSRVYRFDRNDRKSAYNGLTCQQATVDFRKRDLTDTAMLDTVTFNARLQAAEPAVVSRMVSELPALKEQLELLKLRALDGLEVNSKQAGQDWLNIRLVPDFSLLLKFKASYSAQTIHVYALNMEGFGASEFRLDPQQVTSELLDEIGLFLLGRSEKLPQQLRPA